jgi:hypothetical protein
MSAAAAAWGLFALVVGWFAIAVLLAFSLAATARRLAALQTAVEAHRESGRTWRDDRALYEAAGIGPDRFVRGERFR